MQEITPIERVEKVVVVVEQEEKSILDQILELPNESVVLAKAATGGEELFSSRRNVASSVLHRTGSTGWLATRLPYDLAPRGPGTYLHADDVEQWYDTHRKAGATFILLYNPREV